MGGEADAVTASHYSLSAVDLHVRCRAATRSFRQGTGRLPLARLQFHFG
jgi:hypothetical protein